MGKNYNLELLLKIMLCELSNDFLKSKYRFLLDMLAKYKQTNFLKAF